ncbi:MAG: flagellin [Candidatus Caenarcaniphilales bacterium]|nr:flagellin [Candidatus Caenarcaniphilales bacterium]
MDVATSAASQTLDHLQRIRELYVQGSNGTNSEDEANALQREINELVTAQIDLAENTTVETSAWQPGFGVNGVRDRIVGIGIGAGSQIATTFGAMYQVGTENGEQLAFGSRNDANPGLLGDFLIDLDPRLFSQGINDNTVVKMDEILIPKASIGSQDGTTTTDPDTLASIDQMIENTTRMASYVGAKGESLKTRFDALEGEQISLNKMLSHVEDTDIGQESSNLVRNQIQQQTASSMLTQANIQKQFMLSLLP